MEIKRRRRKMKRRKRKRMRRKRRKKRRSHREYLMGYLLGSRGASSVEQCRTL